MPPAHKPLECIPQICNPINYANISSPYIWQFPRKKALQETPLQFVFVTSLSNKIVTICGCWLSQILKKEGKVISLTDWQTANWSVFPPEYTSLVYKSPPEYKPIKFVICPCISEILLYSLSWLFDEKFRQVSWGK